MALSLFSDKSLEDFIEGSDIPQEAKELLLLKLPKMDDKEKVKLFKALGEIYLLGLEEEKAVAALKKRWL